MLPFLAWLLTAFVFGISSRSGKEISGIPMTWATTLPHNEHNVMWLLQPPYPCRCRRSRGPQLCCGLVRGKHPSGEMLCPNWGVVGRGCGRDLNTKPCQEKL